VATSQGPVSRSASARRRSVHRYERSM
jgi:hypothetical protein